MNRFERENRYQSYGNISIGKTSNLSKERIAILVNDMLNDSIKKRTKKILWRGEGG
ncbi:MAG: hypothetical protein ACRD8W_00840 [Nitrososphaeraceae archaeon]